MNTTLLPFEVNASSPGDTVIVAAVPGRKCGVYALSYESDADVKVGFRFGSGDLWCMRIKAGPFAQSFVHPIRGPDNTDLNFRVEGAVNVVGWVQYRLDK